jgi:signal transduction histidine kinase
MMTGLRRRLIGLAARPHLPRRTIRLRLTALYGALFLVSGIGLLALTYVLVSHATASCASAQGSNGQTFSVCKSSSEAGKPTEPRRGSGTGVISSSGAAPPLSDADRRVLEHQAIAQHDAQLHQLFVQSLIALGGMAIVSVVLGWVAAGRALRPLRTITGAARRISATSLHERLALTGPDDELKELADTFDDLLARLERSFEAQRRFVANASHELRTPLARQRAVVQVALSDPDATMDSLRAAHERALASGAQQELLIEALLILARGQAGLERREPFDLAGLTRQILTARETEARTRSLELHDTLAPAEGLGDPRLAERLVANLVDNAISHNVPDGHVEVVTGTRSGRAILSVANTGPLVPEADIERLFQPFQRMDVDRTGRGRGVGLGLSIVKAIADAHGAGLSAHPRSGGGLEIEVSFPAAAATPARPEVKASSSEETTSEMGAAPTTGGTNEAGVHTKAELGATGGAAGDG